MRGRGIRAVPALLIAFCLAACSMISGQAPPPAPPSGAEEISYRMTESLPVTVTLYFMAKDRSKLVACTRTLDAPTTRPRVEVALRELIRGPLPEDGEGLLPVLPENIVLIGLTHSEGVVGVHFDASFREMSEEDRFIARVALVNTLTEQPDVQAVHVLSDGREPGVLGYPAGAMVRVRDGWKTQWSLYNQQSLTDMSGSGYVDQKTVVLYYQDPLGHKLLAETRAINVVGNSYVLTVLDELRKGPSDTDSMRSILPADAELFEAPRQDLDDSGKLVLTLNFAASMRDAMTAQGVSPDLMAGALVLTLIAFIPNIASVRILIEGKPLTEIQGVTFSQSAFTWSDYVHYVGSTVLLYFPNKENTAMQPVYRAVDSRKAHLLSTRIEELLRGPLPGENVGGRSVFPEGTAVEDISVLILSREQVALGLSPKLIARAKQMSAAKERMFAYTLVNTLTEVRQFRKVILFPVDGAGGTLANSICLQEPLIRNPGIIRRTE